MASMRDIKRRRDSIQSTEQITKAMKLVATVKLQKSKAKAENSKPYFNLMYETISSVLCKSGNLNHKYLKAGDSPKKAVIVLTSNRGLAGGYNSNIIRLVNSSLPAADTSLCCGPRILATPRPCCPWRKAWCLTRDPVWPGRWAGCRRAMNPCTGMQQI